MTERVPKSQQADRARAAILKAAQREFSEVGFDRTTIRAVAREASIDPSMVMRYYGSKEGLFAAATAIDLKMPDFSGVESDQLGSAVAKHFLSRWEADDSAAPLRVLLSSSLAGSAAAAKMAEIFSTQLKPVVAVAAVESEGEAVRRAALVASQILGFALCRYVLRLPPIIELDEAAAVSWLGPVIQTYLTGPVPRV